MDRHVSKTLLSLVNTLAGGQSLAEKFPLKFQPSLSSSASSPTQVNVATSSGTQTSLGQLPEIESEQPTSIPIKVINPTRKRDSKSYVLNHEVKKVCHLSCLQEKILEQLG